MYVGLGVELSVVRGRVCIVGGVSQFAVGAGRGRSGVIRNVSLTVVVCGIYCIGRRRAMGAVSTVGWYALSEVGLSMSYVLETVSVGHANGEYGVCGGPV